MFVFLSYLDDPTAIEVTMRMKLNRGLTIFFSLF